MIAAGLRTLRVDRGKCRFSDSIRTFKAKLLCKSLTRALVRLRIRNESAAFFPRRFAEGLERMETVWGALLSFLFVLALALSGHVETPSKEQLEQIEKAEKDKKEQMEKAEKEQKEQKEKTEKEEKSKQNKKSKQKEPDVWQLRQ